MNEGSLQMLVLTRKRTESIRIGDDIVIRVMRTAKGSVKLGIEAPASVRILRGEMNDAGTLVPVPMEEPTQEECSIDALLLQH